MQVEVQKTEKECEDKVIIFCKTVTPQIRGVLHYIKHYTDTLQGQKNGETFPIPLNQIYYIESVEGKTFLYCKDTVYEYRETLKYLESMLRRSSFIRISKTCLLNILYLRSVKPILNHRLEAKLLNDERVIISRTYIEVLREKLKGGE